MADTLTGDPDVDEAIRRILGQDDEDDDADDGDWAGVTELIEIYPTRLDGVNGPASGIPALMAKAARPRTVTRLVKTVSQAKRVTMHVAYPVDKVDVGRAMDGAQDFVKADALEAGAWAFMKAGAQIGTDHRDGTTGAGECVESWIHRAPPWTMQAVDGSTQTVHPGDWCVLIQWSPTAWSRFQKGDLNGVSMQGGAKRRKPPASALTGVRKAAKMPRCGECSKKAKAVSDRYCWNCGQPLSARAAKSAAVAKAAVPVMREAVSAGNAAAGRAAYLAGQYRFPEHRDRALAALVSEFGAERAADLIAGNVTAEALGARVAKAAAADGLSRCGTCSGSGRLLHPASGQPSRTCPSCLGSGEWTPGGDDADITDADRDLIIGYGTQARAGGEHAASAIGYLAAMLGPDVAAHLVNGTPVTPAAMRRGYIEAARAHAAAVPGQEPRIPDAARAARASDFRRPPITVRQSRPAPGSTWPGQGGQQDHYGPGPGIPAARYGAGGLLLTPGLASSSEMGA